MATETETPTDAERSDRLTPARGDWPAGVAGGVAGALAMGALVLTMNPPTMAVAIPSLYALAPPPNPGLGLVFHVSHGAVLGVLFAGLVGLTGLDSPRALVGGGIGWGVVTWAVLAGVVMPVWLGAVGSPASPPTPNFAPPSLLWHVVYGGVLGAVYVAARR